jgi:hypothetical protein
MNQPTTEFRPLSGLQVEPAVLNGISKAELDAMAAAGDVIAECQQSLAAAGSNVIAELLKDSSDFFEWDHYPPGDVYDWNSHAQYYYHAHPPENRRDLVAEEHGHFHTFLRKRGMPPGMMPVPRADFQAPADPDDLLAHFVAISMDRSGLPIRLFTTNRWVTGETWYAADDVIAMLPRFKVDEKNRAREVNVWISAMLCLFRPDVARLLQRRDETIAVRAAERPGVDVYEDRSLEVLSFMDISIADRVSAIARAMVTAG